MASIPIEANVSTEQLLHAVEQLPPQELASFVERLLALRAERDEADDSIPPAGSTEALAAVQRLTTLFADLAIADIDQVLSDPMIALANTDAAVTSRYS
jgi:hypothetical protein